MDIATLAQFKELGIAGITVVGVIWILYQVVISLRKEHAKNQEWFMTFVNENNHQKTEIVQESTKAIVEVSKNIEAHTKALEGHTETLKSLTEAIIKK